MRQVAQSGGVIGVDRMPAASPRADYSLDGGLTWRAVARVAYWAVAFVSPSAGWAVGPGGRITRFAFVDE